MENKKNPALGISHSFDVGIAIQCGVHSAVIYNHIFFWLQQNKINSRNQHEGRTWTYDSHKEYAKYFPYLTEEQVKLAIQKLVEAEILIVGNFNQNKFDRTNWYALSDENILIKSLEQKNVFDKGKIPNRKGKYPQSSMENSPVYNNESDTNHMEKTTNTAGSSSFSISKEKENLMRTHSIEESYWKTISSYSTSQIEYAIKCALSWFESLQNRGEVPAPLGSAVVRALKENWKLPENPLQNNQVHASELMKNYVKDLDLEDRVSVDFGATYAQITVNGSPHAYTYLYEDKKSLEMFKHQVNKFKKIKDL